tara:strand:- start:838 stop:1731 length:894 start_codon:yes stop_codon:yes gene_type:complete
MSNNTMKKYINVNTKFRPFVKGTQEKNTDFIIDLPMPVRNVLSLKLKSFSAPDSVYTFSVSETNNRFEVITNESKTTVSVLPGKYTPDTLNTLLANVNYQINSLGIQLEYDDVLQKFRFTGDNISNVELNFDVQNNYIYDTFGWIIGFNKSYYSNDTAYERPYPDSTCPKKSGNMGGLTVIGIEKYYLADSPVALPNTSLYYLLYVDDFLNNMEDSFYEGCFPSNNNIRNVLAKISTKYAADNNTFYETDTDASFERVYSGPVSLNRLHIKLFDDNNKIVDFNNANYTFLLELISAR